MSIYGKKLMQIIGNKSLKIILKPIDFVKYCKGIATIHKTSSAKGLKISGYLPCLSDKYDNAGKIDRHYFLQDIYVARKVIANAPEQHYDIGSRFDGFISHLLCNQISVTMIDIRRLPITIEGLDFIQGDATNLDTIEDGALNSLSSLHAVEHFGLGRYGDTVDAQSSYKAMKAMQRVMRGGGMLYFSVPVGKNEGIIYNAHRIFNPKTVVAVFDEMKLMEFSYIQNYHIYTYCKEEAIRRIMSDNIDLGEYDCGIFVFQKMQ